MDKTLAVIASAAVILTVAGILGFVVSDQSSSFSGVLNDLFKSSECTQLRTEYSQACGCGASAETGNPASILSDAGSKECNWASEVSTCSDICKTPETGGEASSSESESSSMLGSGTTEN